MSKSDILIREDVGLALTEAEKALGELFLFLQNSTLVGQERLDKHESILQTFLAKDEVFLCHFRDK